MAAHRAVLLHGLATSASRTWIETGWVDILADEGIPATALDLPGHSPGASSDPDHYRDFDDQVLAQLPDGAVDLVGFSLGARTALLLAARHPDRVRRLVVAGVGENLFRSEGHSELLARALLDLERGDEPEPAELATVAHHFAQLARDSGVALGSLSAVLRRPVAGPIDPATLASIEAPVLVALGDRDPAGPIDPLLAALPTARGLTLRGVDHFATPRSMALIGAAVDHLLAPD